MARKPRQTSGFTLIELAIVVAIIGILASAAITYFQEQQMRSKRAEAMTNVAAIAKMVKGYFGESGRYPETLLYWPAAGFTPNPVQWDPALVTEFSVFGYRAEGAVRYRYDVAASGSCGCPDCFTVAAIADLDGDLAPSAVGYFHPDSTGWPCPTDWVGGSPVLRSGRPMLDEAHWLDPRFNITLGRH
jgi:prepilin-type N-terminal cleavage/methylation domain-containing protein